MAGVNKSKGGGSRNPHQGTGNVPSPAGKKKNPGVTPSGSTTSRTGRYGSGKK